MPPPLPPPSLPPNPSLVAILLVIKSREGPSFVFHYPPFPGAIPPPSRANVQGHGGSPSESDDDWSSDGGYYDGPRPRRRRVAPAWAAESRRGKSGAGQLRQEESKREWETMLGYSADGLAKMLCPMNRAWNKTKFEFGMGKYVFVGCPLFVREDGSWKKSRGKAGSVRGTGKQDDVKDKSSGSGKRVGKGVVDGHRKHEEQTDSPTRKTSLRNDRLDVEEAGSRPSPQASSTTFKETVTVKDKKKSHRMSFFHVVFVVAPPAAEYQLRVKEMYDHVAVKFAKILKYQQARSDYVWIESQKMLAAREGARESYIPTSSLWSTMLSESALAKSIAVIYDSISQSRIAHINKGTPFETSFQIPQLISTPFVPTPMEPQTPGLWLSTASMLEDEDNPASAPSPYAALLLLCDVDELLQEIESSPKELSAPLAYFIRNLTPTKSLLHHATRLSVSLTDLQFLSRHLIHWRRARAIPPLHVQNIYIVSPNANMRQLRSAIPDYAARFPTAPSLPKMLKTLSKPVPWRLLPPSKDHRPAYFVILAWLFRHGWVAQLRGFAWIRVSGEVKVAVAEQMKRESALRASAISAGGGVDGSVQSVIRSDPTSGPASSKSANTENSQNDNQKDEQLAVEQQSVADILSDTHLTDKPPNSLEPSLILSPENATALERRWLAYIASSFTSSAVPAAVLTSENPASLLSGASPAPPEPAHASADIVKSTSPPPPQSPPSPPQPHPSPSTGPDPPPTAATLSPPSPSPSPPRPTSPLAPPHSPSPDPNLDPDLDPNLDPTPKPTPASTPGPAPKDENEDEADDADDPTLLRTHYPSFRKYFDGLHPLDEIGAREGVKRKIAKRVVDALMERGVLVVVRHW